MPPLYVCVFCNEEVDIESSYALRMMRGWAKPKNKTLVVVTEQEPMFAHSDCVTHKNAESPMTLF